MQNQLLKYIYTVFLGILIVAFIGLGIDTFYPRPDYPTYPEELELYYQDCGEVMPVDGRIAKKCGYEDTSEEIKMIEAQYRSDTEAYQGSVKTYSRNVSVVALSLSILILIISLLFVNKLGILSDGVLVGGIFTLGYGIILGFSSDDPRFRFLTVTVGLIVAISLGYIRFVKPHSIKETLN